MPDSEARVASQERPEPTGSESMTRRAAVGAGVGLFGVGYAASIGYPVYRYLNTPVVRAASAAAVTEVSLPDADQLAPGAAMMFRFGARPAMLIHHEDGSWSSFDAVCTHLGCTVKFEADKDRIYCECHGGQYDSRTGKPTGGPPPRGLTLFQVEAKDGEVIVARG